MRFDIPRGESPPVRPDHGFDAFTARAGRDPGRPRILLLTSGLGLGHVRAAQAIDAALRDAAHVRTLDLWSLMNPGVAAALHETYLSLVQNYPALYERLFRLDEHTWRQILESESGPPPEVLEVLELISAIAARAGESVRRKGRYVSDKMLLSLLCAALPLDSESLAGNGVRARLAVIKWAWMRLIRRLEPAVQKFSPDVIISTQMVPAAMAAYLKERGKASAAMIGVMTDFGVHDFWKQGGIDRYCVAHESVVANIAEMFPHAREVATGVPLMPAFAYPISRAEARRELQLPIDASVVLVLGGGLGLSVDSAAGTLLARRSNAHLMVMPGRNAHARESLSALSARHPERLRVCDWTERMDVYLRASDLVVGKPGGITVAEALACGRPLLATRSLGGQEGFNVDFLERHGVGGLVGDREVADRDRLQHMQREAWLLGRRDGASRIADIALQLARSRVALRHP
jgi:processive 1,2-diacylglycerol beta-glucosyltransferase